MQKYDLRLLQENEISGPVDNGSTKKFQFSKGYFFLTNQAWEILFIYNGYRHM
jgi:hypothetical protein